MKSKIYIGALMHARLEPVRQAYTYPVYTYGLDLDELPALDREVRLFGYNRLNVAAIHDKDYLLGKGPIKEELFRFLEKQGCADGVAAVELVTMARYFNYIFNPVSFYFCRRADGTLRVVVAEVNNTFGERHFYVLQEPLAGSAGPEVLYRHGKEFHVSPFNDLRGGYDFSFLPPGETLDVRINLVRDGRNILLTQLSGKAVPLTSESLRRTLLRFPFAAAMNVPRILWQAGKLYFGKKLPLFHKPHPSHPMTLPAPPTRLERLAMSAVSGFFARLRRGELRVTLPDGRALRFEGKEPGRRAAIRLRSWSPFWRMLKSGDIGFGDAYVDGDWECDDLPGFFRLFIENADVVDDRRIALSWIGRAAGRLRHAGRRNTRPGSRRNIAAHYDLGNEMYRLFLDESMSYSCALYRRPDETLEQAQQNKLEAVIRKARLGPDDHVLEIGCGWGSFAIAAARAAGCRVTGITLSPEQLAWARQRVRDAGLEDRVKLELCDYRNVEGRFDRIVSLEMLEAVGHEYFGAFFAACDRLLAPDGLAVIQVITIPDQRYDAYRLSTDWIQQRIFPGGIVPSLTALSRAMTRHSRLIIEQIENIGPHYAPTLREWRRRFEAHREDLLKLGRDDRFLRAFRYYFCYCEAGFDARYINTLHLVLTRPGNRRLS